MASEYETEQRLQKRVDKTFGKFEQFYKIVQGNDGNARTSKAIHIVISRDDYGNNFQEDAIVFNRIVDRIENEVEGGLARWFCWCYTIDTMSFMANPELDTLYTWNGCKLHTEILVGQRSKSGNLRRGEVFVMGVINRKYLENILT